MVEHDGLRRHDQLHPSGRPCLTDMGCLTASSVSPALSPCSVRPGRAHRQLRRRGACDGCRSSTGLPAPQSVASAARARWKTFLTLNDTAAVEADLQLHQLAVEHVAAAQGARERTHRALRSPGSTAPRTEVAPTLLGFRTSATLWLTVAPSELEQVGGELADDPEVEFAGAVSGLANLVVMVTCRDIPDLHRYLTHRLGAIPAIRQSEVVVAVKRLKHAETVMDGDRLPNPLSRPGSSTSAVVVAHRPGGSG
jgi:DNA-binding Lrp family transcriptional regulator